MLTASRARTLRYGFPLSSSSFPSSSSVLSLSLQAAPKPQTATRSAYDEVLYGSDSDLSAASDNEGAAPAAGGVKNRKAMARKNKANEEGGAYIREGEDEVFDLLDDRMMSRISGAFSFSPSPRLSFSILTSFLYP
jgi:hypothetical protein